MPNEYQTNLAIVRTVLTAYDERTHMSEIYQPLSEEGEIELYLFNLIHGWFYLLTNSLVDNEVENIKKYVAVGTGQIRGANAEHYKSNFAWLFKDRFSNYKRELKLVKESGDYLPAYFFIRLYKYPLGEEPILSHESLKRFPGDNNSTLIRCFKAHVSHMYTSLATGSGEPVSREEPKQRKQVEYNPPPGYNPKPDPDTVSAGTILKVIGWFILLGIVLYAIAS